jgi:hypothetical protein
MCSLASSDVFHRHEVCSSDKAGSPSGIPRHIFSLLGPHRMMLCRLPSRFVPSSCQGSSYSTAASQACCASCPHDVFHSPVEAALTAVLCSNKVYRIQGLQSKRASASLLIMPVSVQSSSSAVTKFTRFSRIQGFTKKVVQQPMDAEPCNCCTETAG